MKPFRIFGVDPGTHVLGYAALDVGPRGLEFRAAGAVRGGSRSAPRSERLAAIYRGLRALLREQRPSVLVLEEAFYGKSVVAAIRIGEARGVALLCAAEEGVPVAEYAPALVKKAVVGYGRADKAQVASMVQAILGLSSPPEPSDAADALALAICHGHRSGLPLAISRREE